MSVTASAIAKFLGADLIGGDLRITRPFPADAAGPGALVFLKEYREKWANQLGGRKDICVLAPAEYRDKLSGAFIESRAPRLDFARVLSRFFHEREEPRIAETARIHSSARIGSSVAVGEYSVIGPDVVVGDGTVIRNHVVIERGCQIGRHCLIKSSTVLGEEGFGFEFEEDGTPLRIPHLGRAVIGDHVEIGAMNVIARGTLGDTVLSNHVKTDDHVFIAHNVFVGENSVIIAGAEVSGSVKIGRDVWIAPQATILNQLTIGDRAMVGLGAVVTKAVEPGKIVAGNPAKVIRSR